MSDFANNEQNFLKMIFILYLFILKTLIYKNQKIFQKKTLSINLQYILVQKALNEGIPLTLITQIDIIDKSNIKNVGLVLKCCLVIVYRNLSIRCSSSSVPYSQKCTRVHLGHRSLSILLILRVQVLNWREIGHLGPQSKSILRFRF